MFAGLRMCTDIRDLNIRNEALCLREFAFALWHIEQEFIADLSLELAQLFISQKICSVMHISSFDDLGYDSVWLHIVMANVRAACVLD
jgi:hypothetical protein